jgi:SAM-dependent methyltransferase
METPIQFDDYAENYDAALNQGLSATGESKDYFARRRIEWLSKRLRELSAPSASIMDYGCGDGSSAQLLLELLKAELVVGTDTSQRSLEIATRRNSDRRLQFVSMNEYEPGEQLDLVYCNGVFHHIPPDQRRYALRYIWNTLRPGGLFALWENNPWNPGTRYIMSRIPFDRDAVTLSTLVATRMVCDVGFRLLRMDSLFLFPRKLKFLRPIEVLLARVPLGGQYQLLCRKETQA